ncbi:hypothetical protein NKH99_27905 [Mesorhizobium sp. M0854]|uniref:hypothetical protein n=1 Tax=Mesorhizobium sp. M0854 TaxID=2957013 RepID=UPI0033383762
MPPTRDKATKPRPSRDLADQGRKAAARKAATTVEKVARAKRAIEIDLERHGGVYPYAGGRLTAEEVLRRAGLNRALLQKPRHTDMKGDLKAWLVDIKKKQLTGKKVVRKAVTERADTAEGEIALIRQRWAESELEFVEQANEIARLTQKCVELEKEIRVLRSAMGSGQDVTLSKDKDAFL